MALSCGESPLAEMWSPPLSGVETTRRAFVDRVLVDDPRVLDSLLVLDDRHLPSVSYFKYTQPDLQPYMRRVVVTWMMEVQRSIKPASLSLFLSTIGLGQDLEDLGNTRFQAELLNWNLLSANCVNCSTINTFKKHLSIGGFNGWPHVQWPTRPLPKEAPEAPREVCSGGP